MAFAGVSNGQEGSLLDPGAPEEPFKRAQSASDRYGKSLRTISNVAAVSAVPYGIHLHHDRFVLQTGTDAADKNLIVQ